MPASVRSFQINNFDQWLKNFGGLNDLNNLSFIFINLKMQNFFCCCCTFHNIFKLDTRCTYSCIGTSGKKLPKPPWEGFSKNHCSDYNFLICNKFFERGVCLRKFPLWKIVGPPRKEGEIRLGVDITVFNLSNSQPPTFLMLYFFAKHKKVFVLTAIYISISTE